MDLLAAPTFALTEELATAIDTGLSPQKPSPALHPQGEFFDALALELQAGEPPVEATPVPAVPVSVDAGEPAGRQELAAGGNPLPALPDPGLEIADSLPSEPTALVAALGQAEGREPLPASHRPAPAIALHPPAPLPQAPRSQASPAVTPEAATPARVPTDRPAMDGPLVPAHTQLESPQQLPGSQGPVPAPALALRHAASPPPVPPFQAPPAFTPETATPAGAPTVRLSMDGPPASAALPAELAPVPDDLPEQFEGRSRWSATIDEAARADQLPALARAGPQSSPAEPAVPMPSVARPPLPLPVGIHQPGWDQALGERVLWLVKQDVQHAELTLNPPELGALRVRVTVAGDVASVAFASEHGAVREAVESALPQLRQLLAERGLSLAHVDVSAQDSGERWTNDGNDSPPEGSGRGADEAQDAMNEAGSATVSIPRGLVDQYV